MTSESSAQSESVATSESFAQPESAADSESVASAEESTAEEEPPNSSEINPDEGSVVSSETGEMNSSEATSEASEELVDGMRPEIKQAIDDYEAFFDEYCEFLVTYSESDDPTTLLTQYAEVMAQYAITMASFEAMADEDLNDAELIYYTEASARITQKLLETSASISGS
ncbi:MAG: hypothetical protein LUF28_05180 [Clostridiales bacterium]|nr:hypothetical protein [Clostridiales bacterium]